MRASRLLRRSEVLCKFLVNTGKHHWTAMPSWASESNRGSRIFSPLNASIKSMRYLTFWGGRNEFTTLNPKNFRNAKRIYAITLLRSQHAALTWACAQPPAALRRFALLKTNSIFRRQLTPAATPFTDPSDGACVPAVSNRENCTLNGPPYAQRPPLALAPRASARRAFRRKLRIQFRAPDMPL